jgi:ribosomal protein S18 acetylase RimI-like enzyme
MNIRKAERQDIPTISKFAIETYTEAFGHTMTEKELQQRLQSRSVEFHKKVFDHDTFLLAEEEGKLVGYVQFGKVSFEMDSVTEEDVELQRIYVLKENQGQGIGKKLIDAALADPKLKEAKRVFLDVWKQNHGAQRLYESYGFEKFGELDDDFIMVRLQNPQ